MRRGTSGSCVGGGCLRVLCVHGRFTDQTLCTLHYSFFILVTNDTNEASAKNIRREKFQ